MKKFAIIYGSSPDEVERHAVTELSRTLLEYTLEYPVCVPFGEDGELSDVWRIYIGTAESNPYVAAHKKGLTKAEEYSIEVKDGTVVIEGHDPRGVLYGALDFYNKYIVRFEHPNTDAYWENFLLSDTLPSFSHRSAPSVSERGLWTWGHVIYDYRGYIDNLARLKMNSLIIWNDTAPTNARDIVRYAHSRGVSLRWGFSWLWDTDCKRVDLSELPALGQRILEKYEREYAHLGGDGIYFQTFTELHEERIGDTLIAEAAAKFVNSTAALFYEKYPELDIQFGLHATSVKDRLDFIRAVDARIRIVWEDCGAFPFSYVPCDVSDFDGTMSFVHTLSSLRGEGERFGAVTKGLVKLDWTAFEHPTGARIIGESTPRVKKNRIDRKERIWRYIGAAWLANADFAHEAVRRMAADTDDLSVFALVEDGMFEENIMLPVALYSEMLWDAGRETKALTYEVALRSYITYA